MNDFLFVCQENRLRSPTCEHVARMMGYSADSAGTSATAVRPLTLTAIMRAQVIVCMQPFHAAYVRELCAGGYSPTELRVWNIPDDYNYCEPGLVDIIKHNLERHR